MRMLPHRKNSRCGALFQFLRPGLFHFLAFHSWAWKWSWLNATMLTHCVKVTERMSNRQQSLLLPQAPALFTASSGSAPEKHLVSAQTQLIQRICLCRKEAHGRWLPRVHGMDPEPLLLIIECSSPMHAHFACRKSKVWNTCSWKYACHIKHLALAHTGRVVTFGAVSLSLQQHNVSGHAQCDGGDCNAV
jgi:hypothetical protein